MKKAPLILIWITGVVYFNSTLANEDISLGAGAGAHYNGLGTNISLVSKKDMKYLSLGCISIRNSTRDGTSADCGFGAGWINTDILSDNDKHGLGVHLGIINNTSNYDDQTETFFTVSYVHFFSGLNSRGWNIGFTPIVVSDNSQDKNRFLINLGYQF